MVPEGPSGCSAADWPSQHKYFCFYHLDLAAMLGLWCCHPDRTVAHQELAKQYWTQVWAAAILELDGGAATILELGWGAAAILELGSGMAAIVKLG
ncbi:hypothetical protein Baya_13152 [Bagarius yarrelli]|uniref:Uncharacterized protein n=1 Tax=Bagarius yarrelli TaxID=175774 RepID=A0A556V5H0_BAGYA|nr:hypothetical protein Baya_13152 [Bagarius yarrelli]